MKLSDIDCYCLNLVKPIYVATFRSLNYLEKFVVENVSLYLIIFTCHSVKDKRLVTPSFSLPFLADEVDYPSRGFLNLMCEA